MADNGHADRDRLTGSYVGDVDEGLGRRERDYVGANGRGTGVSSQ